MPKVLLINPRRHTHSKAYRQRNRWDRGAVNRILNSSAGEFFGERGGSMARHHHHRRRHNPFGRGYHHHRRRRNPGQVAQVLTMIGGGALGAFFTRSLPQTFLGAGNTGLMGYGANAIVAGGGGWLLGMLNRDLGLGFVVGGGAGIVLRIYSDYVSGAAQVGASDGQMSFYSTQAFPLPYATAPGNPFASPYAAAYPGGVPVAVMPTTAGPAGAANPIGAAGGGQLSKRLRGRFAPS
jgi:hypothetical protein